MNNECLCGVCGTLTRLDDVRFFNDLAICETCQKDMDVHDCHLGGEDGCDCEIVYNLIEVIDEEIE